MSAIPEFADPRLVEIYDAVNPYDPDAQPGFYARLADELDARVVVELGCGTGLVTQALVRLGREVIGVDPSRLMLDVARTRTRAGRLRWVDGGADDIGTPDADLAIMSGHVAQFFVDDDEWSDALAALHAALRPGGHLAFESRNPDAREWERWTRDRVRTVVDLAPGPVETWTDVHDVRDGILTCTNHYVFATSGEELTSPVRLRFRTQRELTTSLKHAGFVVEHVYGDWDRRPPGAPAPELIYISVSDSQPSGGAARRQHCSGTGAASRSRTDQSDSSASSWDV